MNQAELDFAAPRARASDPETSHQAAKRVNFTSQHYALIVGALGMHRATGGTIYELAGWTKLTHVQVARRTAELHDLGRIEPTPGVTRDSPTGRACRVWRIR